MNNYTESISSLFRNLFTYHQKSIDITEQKENPETPISETKQEEKKWWTPYIGVLCTFLSCISLLLTSVIVKKVPYISPSQFSLVRNFGVLIGSLPIACVCVQEVLGPRKYWLTQVLRSFSGATAMYLSMLAYKLLPMATTAIILSTVPIVVTTIAHFTLKEPCGVAQIFSIILTLTGIVLSVHITDMFDQTKNTVYDTSYFFGLACAIGAVVALTFSLLSLKKMSDIHYSVNLVYLGFLGSIENAVITAAFSSFSLPYFWVDTVQMILVAVLGFVGHCFFVLAINYEEAVGVMATCKSAMDIVIATLFDFAFFELVPDVYSLGGGFLIMLAVGFLGLWKWLMNQPKDSIHRKRFKLILVER